ncbi:MAG TPA: MFS transporter [Methylomirabilota bacterium]|nr:MFS transporter [Methylomirabilota bacterium]
MTPPTTASVRIPGRTKLMVTLFVAGVCGSTGHSMSLAVGAILAASLTGTNTWSGLPVSVGALGTALASWPLARFMGRAGRRPGLALGYGLAVAGAVIGMLGVMAGSFALMLAGMVFFGIGNTSNLLARYAAADISQPEQRGKAMGIIVWGSAAGSILGPMLMDPALRVGAAIGIASAASAFLVSVAGYGVAAVLTAALLRPDPLAIAREQEARAGRVAGLDEARPAGPARRFGQLLADVRVQIALTTLMVSQFVMIATTSTSPVYLHDQGHPVGTIGAAVALHLAGMYVTSPLSGWMADRLGRLVTIGLGAVVLIAAVFLAGFTPGSNGPLVITGLFLNGIGWNFAFVAASALLTDALAPSERASVQGLADLFTGLMGALGSAAGGMILGIWGFAILNVVGAALTFGPLAATLLRRPALAAASLRTPLL